MPVVQGADLMVLHCRAEKAGGLTRQRQALLLNGGGALLAPPAPVNERVLLFVLSVLEVVNQGVVPERRHSCSRVSRSPFLSVYSTGMIFGRPWASSQRSMIGRYSYVWGCSQPVSANRIRSKDIFLWYRPMIIAVEFVLWKAFHNGYNEKCNKMKSHLQK